MRWSACLIPLIFGLDQLTKHAVLTYFAAGGEPFPVTSFFNIVLAFNRGISFSLFSTDGVMGFWVLTFLIMLVTAGVLVWWVKEKQTSLRWALALILGGALGNLYDRFTQGHVVDFLDFHWEAYHWAAFNVADSAICVGAALVALFSFIKPNQRKEKA